MVCLGTVLSRVVANGVMVEKPSKVDCSQILEDPSVTLKTNIVSNGL